MIKFKTLLKSLKIIDEPLGKNYNSFIIGNTSFFIIEYKYKNNQKETELISKLINLNLNFKWFSNYDCFEEYYSYIDFTDGYYFIIIG